MTHLAPSDEAVRALRSRGIEGPVVMLNLLRFRKTADYTRFPDLAPGEAISGRDAYGRYGDHVAPLLAAAGGEVILSGTAAHFLIGPEGERWDAALLARYPSVDAFFAFIGDPAYLAGVGHRMAALADSRLLPIVPATI